LGLGLGVGVVGVVRRQVFEDGHPHCRLPPDQDVLLQGKNQKNHQPESANDNLMPERNIQHKKKKKRRKEEKKKRRKEEKKEEKEEKRRNSYNDPGITPEAGEIGL